MVRYRKIISVCNGALWLDIERLYPCVMVRPEVLGNGALWLDIERLLPCIMVVPEVLRIGALWMYIERLLVCVMLGQEALGYGALWCDIERLLVCKCRTESAWECCRVVGNRAVVSLFMDYKSSFSISFSI